MKAGSVRATVVAAIGKVLADDGKRRPAELRDDATLVGEMGLESLELARVVAFLDARLGVEPFAELVAITDIHTVGDLAGAYERALGLPAATPEKGSAVAEGAARGVLRRKVRR